jgi:hypothetical protein
MLLLAVTEFTSGQTGAVGGAIGCMLFIFAVGLMLIGIVWEIFWKSG